MLQLVFPANVVKKAVIYNFVPGTVLLNSFPSASVSSSGVPTGRPVPRRRRKRRTVAPAAAVCEASANRTADRCGGSADCSRRPGPARFHAVAHSRSVLSEQRFALSVVRCPLSAAATAIPVRFRRGGYGGVPAFGSVLGLSAGIRFRYPPSVLPSRRQTLRFDGRRHRVPARKGAPDLFPAGCRVRAKVPNAPVERRSLRRCFAVSRRRRFSVLRSGGEGSAGRGMLRENVPQHGVAAMASRIRRLGVLRGRRRSRRRPVPIRRRRSPPPVHRSCRFPDGPVRKRKEGTKGRKGRKGRRKRKDGKWIVRPDMKNDPRRVAAGADSVVPTAPGVIYSRPSCRRRRVR